MIEPPEVSVVMPVFNGKGHVEAAIRSVLAQGVPVEILAHDDGSTDGTLPLLRGLAERHPSLSVSSAPNGGPARARNVCLERARARWIAFLDHDDIWPPGRLRRQVVLLDANPSAGGVLGHTVRFEREDGNGMPLPRAGEEPVLAGLLQAGLFRPAALLPLGGFDPGLAAADDFDLLLRLVESGWKLAIDREAAVYFRIHPGQWTADLSFASRQTVRAIAMSLRRRRAGGRAARLDFGSPSS